MDRVTSLAPFLPEWKPSSKILKTLRFGCVIGTLPESAVRTFAWCASLDARRTITLRAGDGPGIAGQPVQDGDFQKRPARQPQKSDEFRRGRRRICTDAELERREHQRQTDDCEIDR